MDDRGLILGLGCHFFLLATVSRPALGSTPHPIQQVLRVLSPGIKQLGHEVDHLSPSSASVKNAWNYTSTPPVRLHDVIN
jgi:hypothetical protein